MQNIGEEICGEYLTHILKCDFVSYNILTPDVQGEIDVVGIDLTKKIIYVCEVATHTQGLLYVTNKKADDFNRFYSKFVKDINYAKSKFENFQIIPMLWSPVVKGIGSNAVYNTMNELSKLKNKISVDFGLDLQLIINEEYHQRLSDLKKHASEVKSEFSSPVMRLFQIEKSLENHLRKMNKKRSNQIQQEQLQNN